MGGIHNAFPSVYGHYYGKREAEAEPDPLVYTTGVHAPVVSTYTHGVVAPAVSSVVSPVVYSGIHSGVYSGIHNAFPSVYGHYYGKREAEAEPEAEAEADPLVYTTGVHAPVVSTYTHGVVA